MQKDYNPDFLPLLCKDGFLPPIRLWTRLSAMLLLGTFGTVTILACVVPYPVTIRSLGTIRPAGDRKLVQATATGRVKAVLVTENQSVSPGDIIAEIEDSNLVTQKSQLLGNIQENQLQITQIQSQLSTLDVQMGAQSQVSGRTVSSAKAEVDRLQRDYQERRVTTLAELQAAQANLMAAKAKLRSAEELRDRYKPLAETGAISESLLMEKQQAVQELEFAVKVAEANMQRAQAALNPGTAAIAKATEQIAEEQARGEATLASLNKERSQLKGRLIEIQNQLSRDRKQLQQIELDLSASVVRSPIYGTIIELELRNPGQVVQSGALIAQISPDRAALVVKARVDAQDISQFKSCRSQDISQCQAGFGKAILKFSTYPYPDYGTLYGAVREISADVKTPPEGGKPYYEVTIQPEKPYLVKGNQQYPLQAGMEVSSDIIAKEETVMRFILRKARLLTDV